MAAYKHGIYGQEVATRLIPMIQINAGLPVVFGTAPVHLATDRAEVNKPVLCSSYTEAVQQLGYSTDFEKYTLCEAMKVFFGLYGIAPVVFVNVLDTAKHKEDVTDVDVAMTNLVGKVNDAVLLETLVVKDSGGNTADIDVDYTAGYNDEGVLVITAIEGGALEAEDTVTVDYTKVKAEDVDKDDIIGGIDVTTGKPEGLECIDTVYSMFGMIPGIILAPKFSMNSGVAAVMKSKAALIDGRFRCIAIADVDTEAADKYSDVYEWKNNNNFVSTHLVACWPKVGLDGVSYYMSTHLAAVMNVTDNAYDDVPYKSPSNEPMQIDSLMVGDEEISVNFLNSNILNGYGIVTARNENGFVSWGNNTTAYPGTTDVKDRLISIRRMFNWVLNTLITSYWSKIDDPMNKRFINTIVDSANDWLNGLTAKGQLLGGKVAFLEEENTTTNLMAGKIYFHVYMTPPSPAEDIEFVQEYEPDYVSRLFEG